METAAEGEGGVGTRIMVYVRLRPMAKNEKDSGGRSCVRIVNKRDVFLTEFALETDYLRLKRVRGRHFAFDAAFPDNTTQQEVYNIRLVAPSSSCSSQTGDPGSFWSFQIT